MNSQVQTEKAEQRSQEKEKNFSKLNSLRQKKSKKYKHFCQQHNATIQKKTKIIHNTFVFSLGPNGEVKKTLNQKVRQRKSKESWVKEHKMRKETQDFIAMIKKKIEEEAKQKEHPEIKIESNRSMTYPFYSGFIPYVQMVPREAILYQN